MGSNVQTHKDPQAHLLAKIYETYGYDLRQYNQRSLSRRMQTLLGADLLRRRYKINRNKEVESKELF